MIKIAHLTSAHPRCDTRIFIKMCSSLAENGYETFLVVADGKGSETKNDVNIVDIGAKTGGRLSRMTKTVNKVFKKAVELDVDIYHLHDPELLPIGLKLKKLGKKVIFDSHEDVPKQMLGKPYLNAPLRRLIGAVFGMYESYACVKFDAIIAATPYIRDKFIKINLNTVDINNFPLLEELANTSEWEKKQNEVAYVGGIAKIRGIEEIVQALGYTNEIRLNLAGKFSEASAEVNVKNYTAWSKVNELGFLNRGQINTVLAKSKAGLVTLHPVINYIDALPVKMFEYMAAGIPVIASNFPLWREIVESNECGLCVDPLNPKAIGKAIQYLIDNPAQAERMGGNGRKAVEGKFNWPIEEKKLLDLYKGLKK
jgi:glycosyltransferase involved in cell wall biosynthesis